MKIITVALTLLLTVAPLYAKNKVYVLVYHTFMGKKVKYDISLDEFRNQMIELKTNGFTFVTFNDIKQGKIQGDKNICITIDDGHKTVLDAYYSVLKPLGIKPMLGINTFIIGKKPYVLTWEELKSLVHEGCSVASHGYFHLFINDELYTKNYRYFKLEVFESKKMLEEKLGITVDTFVYPFGVVTEIGKQALAQAGYTYAFTIKWGAVSLPLVPNNLELPRYMYQNNWHAIAQAIIHKSKKPSVPKEPEKILVSTTLRSKGMHQ
ncbi:MAG: polysaccharide deacetylase family protein [Spirochaetes bacterium]|nr:polysaccharide deacetylase family protein [Spirochaetota bacterium]